MALVILVKKNKKLCHAHAHAYFSFKLQLFCLEQSSTLQTLLELCLIYFEFIIIKMNEKSKFFFWGGEIGD